MCDICGQYQFDHSNRFFNLNSSSSGTNQSLANYLTTGFWDDSGFTGSKFNLSNSGVYAKNGSITYNHTSNNFDNNGLSVDRRFLVDEAFKYFELITGIDFQSTTDLDADYQFGDFDNNAYSQVFSSSGNTNYVTVNVNSSWNNSANGFGNYTYHTFLHEIGHGLGLGHQGNYNSEGDYPDDVTFANDSWQSSIMSYFSQQDNTSIDASYAHLSSFMVADLIAIDDLYKNEGYGLINALSGDTIYGFNTNINASDSQIFNEMSTWISSTAFTITDGLGNDTFDFSEFANKQTIDLRPSEKNSTSLFSSDIAGYKGNLVISPGTIIENAIGGNANDTIIGNSNSNTLTGNGGADIINGGDGDDILHGNGGADTINGEGGNDTLNGNNASDILNGGIGNDILNGDNGDDNLDGGEGDDTMIGGTGDDT
jgi:Ca2+-binding RTX toxin-like protein